MKSMAWLVLLAVVSGAYAGEEESTPCDNVESDQQTFACAAFNKQTAERELKSAYDDLIQRMRDQYGDEAGLPSRIEAAEKIWSQLRDADCKVETHAEQPGSKAFQIAWNSCIAQRSDERSEYLRSLGAQNNDEPAPED
ncbi:lysozyme inhibitor LprI family protein [Pseudomonas sp. NBRC 111124]|uniref:lysozyme inhibitor LprI family protein n=1 Tax=Pseudomonas sp. NBRC 111124 TaxID=1661039 RepID=UPI000761A727|nr:lysozyme inhibitor LprI family protein [Pseudomonas sp. NBRC 111124]